MSGPGTTYTRTGPLGDPTGRLADFARFAVDELGEILERLGDVEPGAYPERAATGYAALARHELEQLARYLEGYTTTADD